MIGISSQLLLVKNLNILHTFGEYPAKLENIKDFQSSLEYLGILCSFGTLLQLSSSNLFLFLFSLIYAVRQLPATSYQCVTSYTGSLPMVLCHPLNRGIELAVFVTKNSHNFVGTAHIYLSASQSQFRSHPMLGNG
jgi:hypothetical protein